MRVILRTLLQRSFCLAVLLMLGGCETASFYGQAAYGHWQILANKQPIEDMLQQATLEQKVRQKLELIQQVREFAKTELSLPVGDNYRDYTDIQRPYVIWNLFAAPALSIEPLSWCFPVAGCVSYRGYFDEQAARQKAEELKARGFDVYVGGVAAYSTLGWFDDVVLSTFIARSDTSLLALLIHEIAHQQLYIKDDTAFNESFARAVEIEGVQRWFALHDQQQAFKDYIDDQRRHAAWVALLAAYRQKLAQLYQSSQSQEEKLANKQNLLADLGLAYTDFKVQWQNYSGYDRWMSDSLNNAKLATVGDYNDWVPAFRQVLREEKGDWLAFYQRCKVLSEMDRTQRDQSLRQLRDRFLTDQAKI